MKIIQIQSHDEQLYGLDDQGQLYVLLGKVIETVFYSYWKEVELVEILSKEPEEEQNDD